MLEYVVNNNYYCLYNYMFIKAIKVMLTFALTVAVQPIYILCIWTFF